MKKNVFINKNKKKYYYWIDLLRWVAALGIVFIHYQTLIFKTWQNYFDRSIQPLYEFFWFFYEFGGYGVWFFWIISGFVFTNLYINLNTSKKEFFIARFARLYPLHFLTLIIVLTLQTYSFFNFKEYQIYFVNDFYHFILNNPLRIALPNSVCWVVAVCLLYKDALPDVSIPSNPIS